MPPLNGKKLGPLSFHALAVLKSLSREPQPAQEFNPGVVARLTSGDLVQRGDAKSPYKRHKGGTCEHLFITQKGKAELGL